ncbi:hypothetical protein [Weissella viridescens]|uniref:hypothetical protein n=1 Tax=Weissella viridescens TaxID=1629 RepID=UPI0035287B8B
MDQDNLEVVPQAMMDELRKLSEGEYNPEDLWEIIYGDGFSPEIRQWYRSTTKRKVSTTDAQLRLIKHIWLNEPQFTVAKPKKWIVRTISVDFNDSHLYVVGGYVPFNVTRDKSLATRFNTKEQAERWNNPNTEVVEVEE